MQVRHRTAIWLSLMLVAGFCSFIYELALAQLLTALLGGANLRFATTLGVYIVALGIGSLSFRSTRTDRDLQSLLYAELSLFAIGLTSPVLFVLFQRASQSLLNEPQAQVYFVLLTTHLIIFAMGFFCGREIPILSSILKSEIGPLNQATKGEAWILAADYGGMFLAGLAFPFYLFPVLGLIPTFAVTTFLNLSAAFTTLMFMPRKHAVLTALLLCFALMNLTALIYANDIQNWLSRAYSSAS